MSEQDTVEGVGRTDSLKDTVLFTAILFGSVVVFGLVADKVFGSEEKAKEARKLGYDI